MCFLRRCTVLFIVAVLISFSHSFSIHHNALVGTIPNVTGNEIISVNSQTSTSSLTPTSPTIVSLPSDPKQTQQANYNGQSDQLLPTHPQNTIKDSDSPSPDCENEDESPSPTLAYRQPPAPPQNNAAAYYNQNVNFQYPFGLNQIPLNQLARSDTHDDDYEENSYGGYYNTYPYYNYGYSQEGMTEEKADGDGDEDSDDASEVNYFEVTKGKSAALNAVDVGPSLDDFPFRQGDPLGPLAPPPPPIKGTLDYVAIPLICLAVGAPIFVVIYVILGSIAYALARGGRSLNEYTITYQPLIDSLSFAVGKALEKYECYNYAKCRLRKAYKEIGFSSAITDSTERDVNSFGPSEKVSPQQKDPEETESCEKYQCLHTMKTFL